MFQPIAVVDLELGEPFADLEHLAGYASARILVRYKGRPLGHVEVPVTNDKCSANQIREAVVRDLAWPIMLAGLNRFYASGTSFQTPDVQELLPAAAAMQEVEDSSLPPVTVAVCTRDNRSTLKACLEALTGLDYPHLELLVVDNAPRTKATQELVREQFPQIRYVCEPHPGLNCARNRAILEANGEILAFTDDDVIVDRHWVRALATVFTLDADVTTVTGLVAPAALETETQWLFEKYGGFGRGFNRIWYRADHRQPGEVTRRHGATGKFGTGANMAFRCQFLRETGGFDPALDVGTPTNGGGDLDIFYRVLKEGHTLVYEPRALVRHVHRRTFEQLQQQIENNGIGFYSFLVRNFLAYPGERRAIVMFGLWWLWWWNIKRLVSAYIKTPSVPRALIWAELWGSLRGLFRYRRSQRVQAGAKQLPITPVDPPPARTHKEAGAVAVRLVDLAHPLHDLVDVCDYRKTSVYVCRQGQLLGNVLIANDFHPVSALQLREAIVEALHLRLLATSETPETEVYTAYLQQLRQALGHTTEPTGMTPQLSGEVQVSVVIATFDRPDDLHRCLTSIVAQESSRPVEIIVVDNHPDSGLTRPLLSQFPDVRYVAERRRGLSYALNAGIIASSGDIIICADDDVVAPPGWLEKLVAPFAQTNVGIVTGNVLPGELETEAQALFERYGGPGRGFESRTVNRDWFDQFRFRAVPTWELGATANAAFRATLFRDPGMALFDEALGARSAAGCGADTLLSYQALRSGYTIVYEPAAYVWRRHLKTRAALRRQRFDDGKGHVAYHLTTLTRHGDWRALFHLLFWLPAGHVRRVAQRILRRSDYPIYLNFVEMAGNLAAPVAWVRSSWRVARLGRSRLRQEALVAPVPVNRQETAPEPVKS